MEFYCRIRESKSLTSETVRVDYEESLWSGLYNLTLDSINGSLSDRILSVAGIFFWELIESGEWIKSSTFASELKTGYKRENRNGTAGKWRRFRQSRNALHVILDVPCAVFI